MNKKKLYIIIAFNLIITGLAGCGFNKKYGYDPDDLPETLYDSLFSWNKFGSMDRSFGFSGYDYRKFDLSNLSLDFLASSSFDDHTKWPDHERLPDKFNPEEWFEKGKIQD